MHGNSAKKYLATYPKLMKWINQCVSCQSMGYKPEMPRDIIGGANLRGYFKSLAINKIGVCETCERASK